MALHSKLHLHGPKESKKVDFWGQAVLATDFLIDGRRIEPFRDSRITAG